MPSSIPLPASANEPLAPLPSQPDDVPWPTTDWSVALRTGDDELDGLVAELFAEPAPEALGHTHALVVVQGGRIVVERYGRWFADDLTALGDGPTGPVTPADTHLSWSMAKSVLHAACGLVALDGPLALGDRPDVPAWTGPGDPRQAITFDHLLQMRPGLQWLEEYYELTGDALPDVVTMLYDPEASKDMAGFAASFPLAAEPGSDEAYNYSSGTSNIVAAAVQRIVGGGEDGMRAFLSDRLFGPLGMVSADPRFDDAGTFIASSYLYATARDYARFGLLYLRDGVWDGRRLLPDGWVDHARRLRSRADDDEHWYGAHWWADDDGWGTFLADGFEGQRILCIPDLDLVLVRLGKTHTDHSLTMDAHLKAIAARLA